MGLRGEGRVGLGEKIGRAVLVRAGVPPARRQAGARSNFPGRLAIMAIAFTPGKGIPCVRDGYSRAFADTAGRRGDLAGRFRIRWLSGIEATGNPGEMISSYVPRSIADTPIINQGKYTKKYDA